MIVVFSIEKGFVHVRIVDLIADRHRQCGTYMCWYTSDAGLESANSRLPPPVKTNLLSCHDDVGCYFHRGHIYVNSSTYLHFSRRFIKYQPSSCLCVFPFGFTCEY